MASKLFFNGRATSTPTTQTQIDDAAMAPKNLTVGNVLALIGASLGGQPNTPLFFGDPSELDAKLVSGPLYHAVRKAFAPSDQTNAPSTVVAIRVGTATPATLNLLDTAGQVALALTSTQFGLPANSTKIKVETGTSSGKKMTVQLGQNYYSQDNLARNALSVQYVGAQTSATIAVSNTQVVLCAPAGSVVATIALADAPAVGQLADRISAVAGFTAAAVGGTATTPALNGLDGLPPTDCRTASLTLTANLQAALEWLNGLGQTYVTAARGAAAGAALVNVPFTYLSGGSDPATTLTDWTNALAALQTADVQWVVPLSGDPAVHAAVDAHCQYMSTVGRKERRALVGPVAGTSQSAVMALPIALNSDRTSIVWPGHYDYDDFTGALTLYDPWMSAVLVAAMFSGSDPGTPMTNKTLAIRGLETNPRNPTDTDQMIDAGVLPLEKTSQGFKIVRSISSWLANDNFNRVEVSVGAATDYMARTVRDALDILRGQQANPLVLARAISIAESTLAELARPKPEGPGIIVGDANSPAYRNIRAQLVGDTLRIAFEASPVIPVNFIPVTISIVPYSGTANA